MTSGIVLLDKPAGLSSNHATRRVQRLFGASSAGHLGTLDPFATGLLPVMLDDATRVMRWLEGGDKVYRAELRLGATTDTLDRGGVVVERRPVPPDALARLREALPGFVGTLRQRVPEYSAAKVEGVRRCDLARAGRVVEPKFKEVVVRGLRLVEPAAGASAATVVEGAGAGESWVIEVTCGAGTYVRQLVADLGEAVGCGAHTVELRRTRVGGFPLELAVTLELIESMSLELRSACFFELRPQLPGPVLEIGAAELERFGRGQAVEWSGEESGEGVVVFLVEGGRLRVVAERTGGVLRPRRVLREGLALGGGGLDSV